MYVDGQPQDLAVGKDSLQEARIAGASELAAVSDADPLRQSASRIPVLQRASRRGKTRLPVEDYVRRSCRTCVGVGRRTNFNTVSEFYFAQRDEATQKLNARSRL